MFGYKTCMNYVCPFRIQILDFYMAGQIIINKTTHMESFSSMKTLSVILDFFSVEK